MTYQKLQESVFVAGPITVATHSISPRGPSLPEMQSTVNVAGPSWRFFTISQRLLHPLELPARTAQMGSLGACTRPAELMLAKILKKM